MISFVHVNSFYQRETCYEFSPRRSTPLRAAKVSIVTREVNIVVKVKTFGTVLPMVVITRDSISIHDRW